MSDTTDTSVYDSPPESPGLKDRRSEQSHPKSIKRRHLLAALTTLENDMKEIFPDVDPLQEKFRSKGTLEVFKRCCSLDMSTRPVSSWSCTTSKIRQLTYTLINSVFRHDWGTAARCIHLMLDLDRCSTFAFRTLLLVLFNHPHTNPEIIDNFMKRVLNLRSRLQQLTFLRQMYLLPDDIEAYTREEDLMSTRIQDEGTATSEDE